MPSSKTTTILIQWSTTPQGRHDRPPLRERDSDGRSVANLSLSTHRHSACIINWINKCKIYIRQPTLNPSKGKLNPESYISAASFHCRSACFPHRTPTARRAIDGQVFCAVSSDLVPAWVHDRLSFIPIIVRLHVPTFDCSGAQRGETRGVKRSEWGYAHL